MFAGPPSHWDSSPEGEVRLVSLYEGEREYAQIVERLSREYLGPLVIRKVEFISW